MKFINSVDTVLLGATTYRMFAEYWPSQTAETQLIADALNSIPDKVVFSRSLQAAPWGERQPARTVDNGAAGEVTRLRQDSGKDIVLWGSLSLAQSLQEEGLVDEYHLWLWPIAIGSGKPLFKPDAIQQLKLVDARPSDAGMTRLRYQPV